MIVLIWNETNKEDLINHGSLTFSWQLADIDIQYLIAN